MIKITFDEAVLAAMILTLGKKAARERMMKEVRHLSPHQALKIVHHHDLMVKRLALKLTVLVAKEGVLEPRTIVSVVDKDMN